MKESKFVIVGGGMVAGYAAKQFVELGLQPGELTIFSMDELLPYERPPLSKGFLAGKDTEDSVWISPLEFYRQHGIELRLSSVDGINTGDKVLQLQSGESFAFEQAILATGSRVKKLTIPGHDLTNVFYLRSLDDSKAIRDRAREVKEAVVIGGGFIGMEVAAVLTQLNVAVTMVMPDERIWKTFFTPEMSHFFEGYYKARGVKFVQGVSIQSLGGDGSVERVELEDERSIACQMVVAGIGVQPVTDIFETAGLEVSNGVVVNEYLETSVPGIFAAGDIANYTDVLFRKRRRVEHWDNAVSQGQHCAKAMMGDRQPFKHVPYFFSDVFDLSYEYWGDTQGADRVVHRGDLNSSSFSVWWTKQDAVIAAFCMNRPEERDLAPKWIEQRHRLTTAKLSSPAALI
jgi:NADPH-dependent 2,4-dienoyl-CoA reductase/sulfur reductase-like enzyme